MNRRLFGLTALGALLIGTIAGGMASLPSAHAGPAAASPELAPARSPPPAASQSPSVAPAKKRAPIQCKTTKECPEDNVCTKVSDHKECTPTAIRPPVAPVVT